MTISILDKPRVFSRAAQSAVGSAFVLALAAGCATNPAPTVAPDADVARWEPDIQAFEAADQVAPPAPGGVVFVGSSSIRMWETLEEDFPGIPVVNRGFGGSEMADALHFADRIVLPYQPRTVVVYAGDNDLWNGKSPQQVFQGFRALVQRIHHELPETPMAFIAVKPSIARWSMVDRVEQTNALVAAYAAAEPLVEFIDTATPMLGDDGTPRPELFLDDNLHLSAEGYRLWTSIVEPVVRELW